MGSFTKSFTAAAVLLLHQQTKLNLFDIYIKDFPSEKGMTFHHLFSHSSDAADFYFSPEYWEKFMRLPSSLVRTCNTAIKNFYF
ncbi:serine hydrolase [Cytobacillus firmus]|uniref:serine hydrolase n=1 Tax=Cytobacillus TaxID=2675230 RepID=UPI000DEA2569